jgi:ATP/maltotriose-dependent transcriptional regulator MalT
MALARAALARVLEGRGALLLVAGEAGIGKTTLADAIAAEAEGAGARVVWGRSWEAGGAPAYWPWTQVFRALGQEDPFASVSEAGPSEARDVRFRVFDRAAEQLRVCALEAPVVVVLDDLHAADVPSLLFLQLVARSLRAGARLGVVATYREAEARVAGEVGTLLAKIAREGEAARPARLTAEDVARWIRSEQPDASDAAVARVHEVSEGNPLFVRELLRVRSAIDARDLPDGLRAIIGEHLARVSAETRALLAVASVVGREWSDSDLACLASVEADDVAKRIGEARDAGLVVASGPGRSSFAHILIRDRLHAELAPSRRSEFHAAAGEHLAARGDLAAAAHHLLEAGASEKASATSLAAARAALARLAFEDASRLASRALALAEPSSEAACGLEMVLAESLIRTGETDGGKDAARRAAAIATKLGVPRLLAQAALTYGERTTPGVVDPTMVELLRTALAALGDGDKSLRARVMARLGGALGPPRTPAEADECVHFSREAVALARGLDDPETMLFVTRHAGATLGYMVPFAERFEYTRETIDLARRLGRPLVLVDRCPWFIGQVRESGARAQVDVELDEWLGLVREFPQPHYQYKAPLVLALHAALDGDFDRADRLSREALAIIDEASLFFGALHWSVQRASIALLRGDPASLAPDADRALQTLGRLPRTAIWAPTMRAMILAAVGRESEARRLVLEDFDTAHHIVTALMRGQLALLLRDASLAAPNLGELTQMRPHLQFRWLGESTAIFGPTALVAGEVAAMLGHVDDAR